MRILVDLDGVLTDWGKKYDELLDSSRRSTDNIPRTKDLQQYNLMRGMDYEQQITIHEVMDTPGFYLDLEPTNGAVDAISELVEEGHEVFFVTRPWAGNPDCASEKTAWVDRYFGQWGVEQLIITYDKTLIHGDILIDDKPNIKGAHEPSWIQILFDQPYNRSERGSHSWAEGWVGVFEWIDSIRPMSDYPEYVAGGRDYDKEVRTTSATGGQKNQKLAQLSALDPNSIKLVAEVAGFGALKYEKLNFLKGYDWSLSYDAAQRHQLAFWNGEDNDPESGLPHLAHAAWHMLAQLSFSTRGLGTDDRYTSLEISQLQTKSLK